jgi:hypothetical protein
VNKEHPNESLEPEVGTNHTGKLKADQVFPAFEDDDDNGK